MKKEYKEIKWLLDEKYRGEMSELAKKDIKRLDKGEPVDYIIGFVNFLKRKIDLSSKPFVPRPETEYWVGEAIKDMKQALPRHSRIEVRLRPCGLRRGEGGGLRILDIFSGTGCVGIAVLKNMGMAIVDFAEKEKKYLKQIEINLKINRISKERFSLIGSDIFQKVKRKYDFILANPPYIAESRKDKVQKSVLKYEPKIALFGGKDGFFYIKKFLMEARNYLNENGKIYMEFDSFQKNDLAKLLKNFGYDNFSFKKDQYGKWRYLIIN